MNQSILLVEDNPDDAALSLRALGKSTFTPPVVVANDGVEALDFLFGTGEFQGHGSAATTLFVLLDLKLPKVHGLEVLRRIREDARTRALPVIIFTSSTEECDIVKAYSLGANSYICKPVDYSLFRQKLQEILAYWLVSCRVPATLCDSQPTFAAPSNPYSCAGPEGVADTAPA